MSLLEKIRADQLAARKARDAEKVSTLTTLLSDAARVGKDDGDRESTDAEVIAVVRKFLKSNAENMRIAGDRRDSEWCDTLDAEREVVEAYLPKQMTKAEIMDRLKDLEKNKGALMKYLKDNFAG